MKFGNIIYRIRDGMLIRCANPALAQSICLQLNIIHCHKVNGVRVRDNITYAVRSARPS